MIAASGQIQRRPVDIREFVAQLEKERGIRSGLYSSLIGAESSWNPEAVSPTGARGLAQIIPSTGRQPGFGVKPLASDDPYENARFGADYLGAMLKRYKGDEEAALLAYNQGPGVADVWVSKQKDFGAIPQKARAEGEPYLAKVLGGVAETLIPSAVAADEPQQPSTLSKDQLRAMLGGARPQQSTTDIQVELGPFEPLPEGARESVRPVESVPPQEPISQAPTLSKDQLRQMLQQARPQVQPQPQGPDSPQERFGRSMAQTLIAGPAQLMSRPLGALGEVLPEGPVADYLKRTPEAADEFAAKLRADRKAGAPEGIDWASLGGDVAATLPAAGLKVAQGLGKGAQFANQVAQGAVAGAALTPTTEQSVGVNAGIGAGVNALLGPVVGKLAQGARPAADKLRRLGVRLTPGQRVGGAAQRIEQGARSIPLVGDLIKNREREAFADFNRAVGNSVLEPVGRSLPKDIGAGHEMVKHVEDILGARYDKLLTKAVASVDQEFRNELTTIAQMAQQLPKARIGQLKRVLQAQLVEKLNAGPIGGRELKRIDSELGRLATKYVKSQSADEQLVGELLSDVHLAFKHLIERSSPKGVATELKKTNAAWARFVRLQSAAAKIGTDQGIFTPEQFSNAVRMADQSKRHGAYAKGEALMQDLSDAGRDVLGNKLPDSGTATRAMVGAIGAGIVDPSVLATMGAAALPYTRLGMGATNALMSGPTTLAPYIAPQLGVMGANKLLEQRK